MAKVLLENLSKHYNEVVAVKDFDLEIPDKEFVVLVGPSGCGKTTTLRIVAGLEDITSGNIYIDGKVVNELPPKDRDIAMVFQNYALYPHMSVYDNLAFGLRRAASQKMESRGQRAEGRRQEEEGLSVTMRADSAKLPLWAENLLIETTRKLPKGLRYQSDREKAIDRQVRTISQILQIESLLERLPKQLSGGQ